DYYCQSSDISLNVLF
nr:immunoglobulin light chain junction region [Macaca mulatta]MOW31227.1 immunoglobulin light chain junction region [Macaca mulatta]MOW31482.1 immunoglobulin light chain junction region [Macaca mulatta]MOX75676.1 immunoglobulin light chain junction region [Macaca mulatta]MOX77450.1 immunoglobulin light chain junction region [Macaca mulatta]